MQSRKGFGDDGDRGYAMAALLVAMSVMAVLMSALLPVWSHMAAREKEEELVFRGKQYARAIGLFQRKFANAAPPSIDVLVEQRFLRKKYKDPITNDDFQPIYANQGIAPPGGGPTAVRPGQPANQNPPTVQTTTTLQQGFGSTGIGPQGGIIGVTSKSKEESIKVYNGRTRYNEWAFVYIQTSQRPGMPQIPGGQGRPGQQPGQPGPFGMQPGNMPGMGGPRGNFPQPPPGFGQPNRPPINGQPSPFGQPQANPNRPPMPNPFGQNQRRPGGGQ
jgi:type II secretory pathway pseudopilin PulG